MISILSNNLRAAQDAIQKARIETETTLRAYDKEDATADLLRLIGHNLDQMSATLFTMRELVRNK